MTGDFKRGEVLRLPGDFPVDRDDDTAGRLLLQLFFVLLTSIRGWDYPFYVRGGFDSEPNGSASRAERKSKSLFPYLTIGGYRGIMRREGRD